MKVFFKSLLMVLLAGSCAVKSMQAADEVEFKTGYTFHGVRDTVGEFPNGVFVEDIDGSGSYVKIEKIENGFSFESYLEDGDMVSPYYEVQWPSDEWTLVTVTTNWEGNINTDGALFLHPSQSNGCPIPKDHVRGKPLPCLTQPNLAIPGVPYRFFAGVIAECLWEGGFNCDERDEFGRYFVELTVEKAEAPLTADFNLNGKVDFGDFLILAEHFGQPLVLFQEGDANHDFQVNFDDFLILQENFGRTRETSAAAVPEPSSLMLLVLAIPLLLVRRRRRPRAVKIC